MAQYKRPAAIASAVKTAYSERLAQDMDIEPSGAGATDGISRSRTGAGRG
ncbi:hypothetical protein HB117_12695 [Escherichia coli]|nr:hypothetical protein HB117_12695 [Escherichia coli]